MSSKPRPIYVAAQAQTLLINAAALLAIGFVGAAAINSGLRKDPLEAAGIGLMFLLTFAGFRSSYPLRYEVWPDHLAVVFLFGRWRIRYDTIDIAYETHPLEHIFSASMVPLRTLWFSFGWLGARTVTVLRRNRRFPPSPSAIIYPENRAEFLECLHTAMWLRVGRAPNNDSDAEPR